MKSPLIRKSGGYSSSPREQLGVTIVLVALTMVAIMAMAALSIDVVTLYLANAEAQRTADAAALAGARMLSLSGMTGDPDNSTDNWPLACALAKKVAIAAAEQNTVGGVALTSSQVTVTFPNNRDPTGCSDNTDAFGVNPLVTVKVTRPNLPTFFSRIWGKTGASVGGTATAEAFNSSNSNAVGNGGPGGSLTPVQPRCVKPWIVPNHDPGIFATPKLIKDDGTIQTKGIRLSGAGTGIVGETFTLVADCNTATGQCGASGNPIPANPPTAAATPPTLQFVPGQVLGSPVAVPTCGDDSLFQRAVAGCDQTTVYQCGVQNANTVDLSVSNMPSDTIAAGRCLINHVSSATNQDSIDTTTFPYQIKAGDNSPLKKVGVAKDTVISSSNSIVTIPIYDSSPLNATGTTQVTIVGFLQVFINSVDTSPAPASVNVTVLNVSGCGNGTTTTVGTAVSGTSPVPVRLITYP